MDLNEIYVFVKVAQLGSFSRAAEALNLPKSSVSTKVSSLEARLGAHLIHRTTRKINLTQVGQQFYERCVHNILNLQNAEEEVTFSKTNPTGRIVVSAPIYLGGYFLPSILKEYKKSYPLVSVELILTDRNVDMISEGVDLSIRAGQLEDSLLISKKIGLAAFGLYASSRYLKEAEKQLGVLAHPKDLKNFICIQFTTLGRDNWTLTNGKQTVSVPMKGEYLVDDVATIKEMIATHQGIGFLPTFSCVQEEKSKELIKVLPEWKTEIRPIHFIYPSGKYVNPKIRQFIQFSEKHLKEKLIV